MMSALERQIHLYLAAGKDDWVTPYLDTFCQGFIGRIVVPEPATTAELETYARLVSNEEIAPEVRGVIEQMLIVYGFADGGP